MFISYKTKKILTMIGAAMLGVLMIVGLTNLIGIGSFKFKEANTANLYQDLTFAGDKDGLIEKGLDGVSVELLEDNVIKAKGTAEKDLEIVIGTITLKAGESYVFDSGLKDGSRGTIYMSVCNKSTNDELVASYRGAEVFDDLVSAEQDLEVVVKLIIKDETKVSEQLHPVLCEGNDVDDVISFWKK